MIDDRMTFEHYYITPNSNGVCYLFDFTYDEYGCRYVDNRTQDLFERFCVGLDKARELANKNESLQQFISSSIKVQDNELLQNGKQIGS